MMAQPLDRQTLECMKRADLQRLCKDHGIKANLKTEALVDLLLDSMQPPPRRTQPAQPPPSQPRRASSLRNTSRSSNGSRLRGTSSSSVIIHDTDEEEETDEPQHGSAPPESHPAPPSSQSSTASHTKKSKQTQYRLGVGRPTLTGGSGPRAVTKSVSLTKTKKGKGSTSVKPSEDAIQEEEEPVEMGPVAGPSGTSHETEHTASPEVQPSGTPPVADLSAVVQIIQPLKDQIGHLQSEVQRLTAQAAGVEPLRTEVAGLSVEVETLRSKLADMTTLEAEVHRLRELTLNLGDRTAVSATAQSAKSAGKARATDIPGGGWSPPDVQTDVKAAAQDPQPRPGFAAHVLGKHPRDSEDCQLTGIADAGKESEELLHRAIRPSRKRAKLSPHASGSSSQGSGRSDGTPDSAPGRGTVVTPAAPAFTIFSGPEEPMESYLDPPPPTTHLSDLLELPPANTAIGRFGINGTTATANAPENNVQPNNMQELNAFNFSFTTTAFHPMTSTPYGSADMPSFTYPDPPTSPTPAVTRSPSGGYVERAGGRLERNDLFHPHGRPRSAASRQTSRPPSRASTSEAGPSPEGTVNPSSIMGSAPLPTVTEQDVDAEPVAESPVVSSTEIGHVFGLGDLPLPPETPAPAMKRTMYGTELEGDTRFGDFGVEGVAAAGFWVGAAPRF
ncbi:hypothetical protein DAEQUDRAFT_748011 [Daedalea quercina L-15889]|uniref:Uncharacterized protein n=1 Tax=Daedalea quercina L-15889 TaxID=1314783 RepID=A0A165UDJ8_9APHY|nr:hypothetical protein DAEQUDRAFT_748011 [Daedalea quercina L-15889]